MHVHGRDEGNEKNPERKKLLKNWRKYQESDGLNSLDYKVCR